VEVVTDVKFFEQRLEQRTTPREATGAESQRTQVFDAVVVSPTSKMNDSLVRWRRVGVSACGSVAPGRHLRQSARLWERRRPPARRLSRGAGVGGRAGRDTLVMARSRCSGE